MLEGECKTLSKCCSSCLLFSIPDQGELCNISEVTVKATQLVINSKETKLYYISLLGAELFQSPRIGYKVVVNMTVDLKDDRINTLLTLLFQLKKRVRKIISCHPLFLYCLVFIFCFMLFCMVLCFCSLVLLLFVLLFLEHC